MTQTQAERTVELINALQSALKLLDNLKIEVSPRKLSQIDKVRTQILEALDD